MIITKEHIGKNIWLEPAGNNVYRGKSDEAEKSNRGCYYRVIKVARVNIAVAKVKEDGSLWREINIKRSEFNENFYKSGLNAGYYVYADEAEYDLYVVKGEVVDKIINAIKYNHTSQRLRDLPISQLNNIASLLGINLSK